MYDDNPLLTLFKSTHPGGASLDQVKGFVAGALDDYNNLELFDPNTGAVVQSNRTIFYSGNVGRRDGVYAGNIAVDMANSSQRSVRARTHRGRANRLTAARDIAHPTGPIRAAREGRAGPADRHRGLRASRAAVSDEVDAKIREQIKAGTFPRRLKPEDWQSGSINWLLDVIAPDRKTAGRVIANFRQVGNEGELRLHPQIGGLVEKEMLEKLAPATKPVVDSQTKR